MKRHENSRPRSAWPEPSECLQKESNEAPRQRRRLSHPAVVRREHQVILWGSHKGLYDDREHRCLLCYEHLGGLPARGCQCRHLPIVSSPLKNSFTAADLNRQYDFGLLHSRGHSVGSSRSMENLNRKFRKMVMQTFSSANETVVDSVKENRARVLSYNAVSDKLMRVVEDDDEDLVRCLSRLQPNTDKTRQKGQ
ncbi:unnamed protein product [Kuraishia capsulata CBS 1993]|uniref:Uncharacterized protein n=1 Tax=Kuraishia capsulata CBS 1993 TaxID=1382522 RepID=W6MWT2_9ASCO|nr:uncharacterized protein KUCA_T00003809001 [Kuraishia capsulata CBS 1993]CDK27830.1 unnamed protein product [Kuraishia capsulata CBS 1993]